MAQKHRQRFRITLTDPAPSDLLQLYEEFEAFWTAGASTTEIVVEGAADEDFIGDFKEEAELTGFHIEEKEEYES